MRKNLITTAALIAALGFVPAADAGWQEGVAAFQAGNLSAAANEFKSVVDAQGDWPGGHYMYGWTRLRQGQHQEAITHLRKAYELDSNNLDYQLRLGEAYVNAGRYGDAATFLGKIDSRSFDAEKKLFLAQLKAVAYTKTGQEGLALAELKRAADLAPKDAKAQYQYGTAAYNDNDTAAAVKALEKAAQLASGDAAMHSAYAKALNRQGRESRGTAKIEAYRKGAEAAQKLVSLDASYDNLMLLGEAKLGAKDYDGAVEAFTTAASKNASDWLPHYYLGQAYTAKQQYNSANAALELALDKTGSATDTARIWKQLGFVYEKQKKYDDAISAYQRAGDQVGVTRVTENKKTLEHNKDVEQEAAQIQQMQAEQERIKKELEALAEGKLSDDPPYDN